MGGKSKITVFSLAMMTVAAVCSLRGLPMLGKEGASSVFYVLFATIMFLVPASMVSAELGSAFNKDSGGVYTWVKEAFGGRWGFVAIWLQWLQNVVWYPTVLGFAGATLTYVIGQEALASNRYFTGTFIIISYLFATWIAMRGLGVLAKITSYGVLIGTIIPGILIIVLGTFWVVTGNPLAFLPKEPSMAMEFSHARYFPHISGFGSIAFLAGIILLFAGVEVHSVHAADLENPPKQFPQAILLASIIIFLLFMLGSLSVAAVIPAHEISLTAGLMQAFNQMFSKFGIGFLTPVVGVCVAFGALGGVLSWISGPSKGFMATATDGEIPPFFAKVNENGVQANSLYVQALIVVILGGLYFIMSNVNVAYFVLSAMTVTLYLVMYVLMYLSAIRLRFTQPNLPRAYKVPGGVPGMIIISGIGLIGVLFSLFVAFFPPSNLTIGNPTMYVSLVVVGTVIGVGAPLIISAFKKPEWKQK